MEKKQKKRGPGGDSPAVSPRPGGNRPGRLPAGACGRGGGGVTALPDQTHETADDTEIAATAAKAVRAIRRGVVAVDAA